jgi:hypothetical protein
MTVHEVPRQLGFALNHLVFEILVFSLLVNDVASIQLLHLLFVSGSLSQSTVMLPRERPQVLDTFLSWWLLFLLILKLSLLVSSLIRSFSEAHATADNFGLLTGVILSPLFIFDYLGFLLSGIQIVVLSFISAFFGVLVVVVIRWLTSGTLASLRRHLGCLFLRYLLIRGPASFH